MRPVTTRAAGSSPRMRGTGPGHSQRVFISRFIPAYAGNSCPGLINPASPSVHPRVCGEQVTAQRVAVPRSGSSPRMRGTGRLAPQESSGDRFHPRVCGEQPQERRASEQRVGFIPAYAGNRASRKSCRQSTPVHPRVCGEQADSCHPTVLDIGSSPRMRGTGGHRARGVRARRFIPAYAGNRDWPSLKKDLQSVHPRVCGEQILLFAELVDIVGSSPRMRGTVNKTVLRLQYPAVHPRVCGEQIDGCPIIHTFTGFIPAYAGNRGRGRCLRSTAPVSSPRMRGTALRKARNESVQRFIPAYAGNRARSAVSQIADAGFIPAYAGNRAKFIPARSVTPVHPRVCGNSLPVAC